MKTFDKIYKVLVIVLLILILVAIEYEAYHIHCLITDDSYRLLFDPHSYG